MTPEMFARALLRRWYVLALVAVLTAGGAWQVLRPEPRFVSSAVLLVKSPVTQNQPNQLTNLQPALAATSYSVILQLRSPEGRADLRQAGVSGTYRISPRNSGTSVTPRYVIPSLQIVAEQPDGTEAGLMVQRIMNVYSARLEKLQADQGIAPAARLTAAVVSRPGTVEATATPSRALAGVGLLGLLGGVTGALALDSRRRRTSDATPRPGPPPQPLADAVAHR
ncbi:hypothetical protein SRB5_45200 [Streptomyces sp. RB5]|uniref:Polysaccharide chain length determinant N-terminal domain-containing protein n=1 Tax=Streptomyces smaragdinus TaxID=2585196 RepID=A0A7K0CLJ2_9ACTN|nr:hypothetical protein [Streptomyces smaragdinus]MQY14355.1 hypothetical protein [Streptomyces smaragdinus]